ncbi:hypothetical protein A5787_13420 [Mycobacterium sp. 852002-50816_SCH5313054-b]|nr:hypothetical protein A5787_13420 [Mycobacterium sp. 852002-50816_SCH5313054-b]
MGAADGGVVEGAAVGEALDVLGGAACRVEWQPHSTAPSNSTIVSLRVPITPFHHTFIGETVA